MQNIGLGWVCCKSCFGLLGTFHPLIAFFNAVAAIETGSVGTFAVKNNRPSGRMLSRRNN
jgi:hypothetical protein